MKSSLSLLPIFVVFLIGCSSDGSSTNETGELELPNDPASVGQTQPQTQTQQSQSTTSVTFDITVPVYQSNELRVDVVWGDSTLPAKWVRDESWSASGEFPAESEGNLKITFYDRNGSLELASFSQQFKIGSNATQSFQVIAEQFDASLYDADDDGTHNLAELSAGTDPLFDENSLFEIRDTFSIPNDLFFKTQQLEASFGDQRPYSETHSEFIPYKEDDDSVGTSIEKSIEIDADGNGSVSDSSWAPWYNQSHSGIRTHLDGVIKWEGSYGTYDGDYGRSRSFTNEVTLIDASTRGFKHQLSESYSGTYRDTWEISSDLIGELIEGSDRCIPVSGTITREVGTNRRGFPFSTRTTTITKAAGDRYWKVAYVNSDDENVEILVRELNYRYADSAGREYPSFICDFVDF